MYSNFKQHLQSTIDGIREARVVKSEGVIDYRVAATAEIGKAIQRGMVAHPILDGIVRNVYKHNTGKTAAWTSASHIENPPKKKENPTP